MSMAPSGSGSGSGNATKVGALLVGAGMMGIIVIFVGPKVVDDDPPPTPTAVVTAAPTTKAGGARATDVPRPTSAPTAARNTVPPRTQPAPSGDVTLTIMAYGLPARVSARAEDPKAHFSETVRKQCVPEIFPEPCITDYKMDPGTNVIVSAGNALAGYWSELESLDGGGCRFGPKDLDQACNITVFTDVEITAKYRGSQALGAYYTYPTCPPNKGNTSPSWLRC